MSSVVIPPRMRGVAMAETVLVLPLIFVVLALLFFFGQAMTRLQRSSATDRYEAWRQAQYAPGPGVGFAKNPVEFDDNNLLNEAFFAGNAERVDIGERAGRITVRAVTETLADQTRIDAYPSNDPLYDPSSAEDMVRARHEHLPAWWRVDLETEHTSDVPLYQRYAGAVRHQHTVIDGDWSYGSWIEQANRGQRKIMGDILVNDVHFIGDDEHHDGDIYPDLDDLRPHGVLGVYETYYRDSVEQYLWQMDHVERNPLARGIRRIYLSSAAYAGPQVLPELPIITLIYESRVPPEVDEDL